MTRRTLIDGLYLLALMVYALAGLPLASFHGDEAMQIYMSGDYWTAFVHRQIESLTTLPPYPIDSDGQLRLLNGSLNRHAIGLSWHVAGYDESALPPRPGWDWGLSYADNVATAHRPPAAALLAARLPSSLLLAGAIPLMFALGGLLGGRTAAYAAAGLLAFNPVLLLNGRRAMQEGALLFFGLLAVWGGAWLAARPKVHPLAWLALAGACGLALVSKHSTAPFVVGALAAVPLARLVARPFSLRRVIGAALGAAGAAALAAGLFVALSPALWLDPAARIADLLMARAELLDIQVAVSGGEPQSMADRVRMIVGEPFLAPLMHFEVSWWRAVPEIDAEIAAYHASPLAGIPTGGITGAVLTVLVLVGAVTLLARRSGAKWALLAWGAAAAAALLINPLPWQRYALPWIPAALLLAALGIERAARIVRRPPA